MELETKRLKLQITFDRQIGFMVDVGKTYRKEPYICFCFPLVTIQFIKK